MGCITKRKGEKEKAEKREWIIIKAQHNKSNYFCKTFRILKLRQILKI